MSLFDLILMWISISPVPILILREYRFNEARSIQALEGIYSTVVLRDILQRNHQVDQGMLQKIILFLCSNIGSITSPNNIGNVLFQEGDIQGRKSKNVAGKTVDKYISMLRSAFVFYSVGRYDVKGNSGRCVRYPTTMRKSCCQWIEVISIPIMVSSPCI